MAWTYTTLKSAIQDYLETTETTFVNNLGTIISQAENRILKTVQLPDFRKNTTGTMTASNAYLATPTDFLAPYSLALDNSGYEYLLFKDVNFIRAAYPVASTTGVPKYYGLFDDDSFIVGPIPLNCIIFINRSPLQRPAVVPVGWVIMLSWLCFMPR